MIGRFRDRRTEALYRGDEHVPALQAVRAVALRKLDMLDAAADLRDLRSPPGNRLEVLQGNRAGQYSIRINDRWHICFIWHDGAAEDVEIVDYH